MPHTIVTTPYTASDTRTSTALIHPTTRSVFNIADGQFDWAQLFFSWVSAHWTCKPQLSRMIDDRRLNHDNASVPLANDSPLVIHVAAIVALTVRAITPLHKPHRRHVIITQPTVATSSSLAPPCDYAYAYTPHSSLLQTRDEHVSTLPPASSLVQQSTPPSLAHVNAAITPFPRRSSNKAITNTSTLKDATPPTSRPNVAIDHRVSSPPPPPLRVLTATTRPHHHLASRNTAGYRPAIATHRPPHSLPVPPCNQELTIKRAI
ncbi:hypothetical protein BD779DRAFT_1674377 [Infundibulicybe gibba]|nr:hypothetical protein BD779DRAFT_1674377 [Infundibulicybe gibba]